MKKLSAVFWDILLKALYIKPLIRFFKRHRMVFSILLLALLVTFALWLRSLGIQGIIEYKRNLMHWTEEYPLYFSVFFFLSYCLVAVIGLPGTTIINIIAGFLFGFAQGTLLAVFAVTIGSSIAFLITRFFLHDFLMRKGKGKIKKIYARLNKHEVYYLFAFRVFPFTPLFFTNTIMALSSIRFSMFYTVSFLCLIPWVAIYANMGSQLSHLENLEGLVEPDLIFAFALIALFPLSMRVLFRFFKRMKKSKEDLLLGIS